jgi:hypothetical protein
VLACVAAVFVKGVTPGTKNQTHCKHESLFRKLPGGDIEKANIRTSSYFDRRSIERRKVVVVIDAKQNDDQKTFMID